MPDGNSHELDAVSRSIHREAFGVLVGREVELEVVAKAALERRSVVVDGIAGIGKTRLLQAVADRLRADGVEVIALSGTEATAVVPLSPLLRLCPPGAQDAGPAIISELYRRSRSTPVAVVVDDAQLLDDATAAIVRHLAMVDLIGLVVAVRTGEPTPLSIRSIVDDAIGQSVTVGSLDRRSTDAFIRRLLGPVHDSVLTAIWAQSEGHPLFVRELILAGVETGALRRTAEGWEAESSPIWSARLRALMANRLLALDASEREAMELLAIAGRCEFSVVAEFVAPDVIFALERRALVRVDGGFVEIDHPLFHSAVREATQPSRSAAMRRRVADALESASTDPDLIRVTELRLEAGDEVATSTLQCAIDDALRMRLPREAEIFARAAIDTELEHAQGYLALALAMQWRWEEADEAFARCHEADADLTVRWMEVNFEYRADPAAVEAMLTSMLANPDRDPRVDAMALRAQMFVDDLDAVIRDHERFGDTVDLQPELQDLVAVDIATCATHSMDLDRLDAVVASRGDRLDEMDPVERVRLTSSAVAGGLFRNGLDATQALMDDELARAAEQADPDVEVITIGVGACAMHVLGRHAAAVDDLRRAADISAYARHRRHTAFMFASLGASLAMIEGGDESARRLLDEEEMWPDGVRRMTRPIADFGRAVLTFRRGEDAHDIIDDGIAHAQQRRSRIHEAGLLWLRAQFGRPHDAIDRLDSIVSFSGAGLIGLMAADARALHAGDVGALERVTRDAAAFGAVAIAAEAADRVAAAHLRNGDVAAACCWQRQVKMMLREQPGQRLLALHPRSDPVLSPREEPIVEALLAGASNRDIAASLFISHRTVESHLRRVYRRLGVGGRHDLARAMLAPTAIRSAGQT